MNLMEGFRVALVGLQANKMRSALTMLGIIIGVGSVITMIAIGRGASADVQERIKAMGTNLLIVWPGQARRGHVWGGMGSRDSLKPGDADAILRKIPSVAQVAPNVDETAQVKWKNMNTNVRVAGTTPAYVTVNNHPVEHGRFFTDREARGGRSVCVIGTSTVENLFGRSDPLGQRIRIKNVPFEVIGILKAKGGGSSFRDPDDIIVVPITVAMRRLFGQDHLDRIYVAGADGTPVGETVEELNRLMRQRHRIRPDKEDDFNVRTQEEILETYSGTARTFTLLLASIAAVSLLVGGIGVMNIMLVSVTERTREIGIRKAIGAKRRDILVQFLIESVTLSVIGGVIGIALGVWGASILSDAAGWRTTVTPDSIALAFFFSAAVGIGFGLYPAQKAAVLDPIEALRYE
ncbi:MAG: ABC transporter permease [Armatimonadota bacterium]|jgi:ABC-type antimicrobial peptide transport system permease subunit